MVGGKVGGMDGWASGCLEGKPTLTGGMVGKTVGLSVGYFLWVGHHWYGVGIHVHWIWCQIISV